MKALQLVKPQQFRFIEAPEPAAPGPGEALVRVQRVGICGTDYSGFLGKMPFFSYPRIPGHELGVEVLAVGPGVTNVQPGDRCAVEPYMNCGRCFPCRKGATSAGKVTRSLFRNRQAPCVAAKADPAPGQAATPAANSGADRI